MVQIAHFAASSSLLKNSVAPRCRPSAAEAVVENNPDIAAVNRRATQKQNQNLSFSAVC
jgi:hypothetical protein